MEKVYSIHQTEEFEKRYNKLDPQLQQEIDKAINQLGENPHAGKPLGYDFFREKKIKNYRIYYLIYDEYVLVFLVTISTKKNQQDAINKVKTLLPYYQQEVRKRFSGQSSSKA